MIIRIVWFLNIVDHNERSIISVVCLWKWESFFVCTISAKKRNFLFSVVPSSMKPFKQVKYHHQTPFVSINNTFFLVSSIFLCHHQQVVSFRFTSSNAVHHWWLTLSLLFCASSLHFSFHFFIPFFLGITLVLYTKRLEQSSMMGWGVNNNLVLMELWKKFVEKNWGKLFWWSCQVLEQAKAGNKGNQWEDPSCVEALEVVSIFRDFVAYPINRCLHYSNEWSLTALNFVGLPLRIACERKNSSRHFI